MRQSSKNKSHSIEKLIRQFPEAGAENTELGKVLAARRRGSRNDSSADFMRALNFVNADPDLSLSVKVGQAHNDMSNFANRATVTQKCLTPHEIGKQST